MSHCKVDATDACEEGKSTGVRHYMVNPRVPDGYSLVCLPYGRVAHMRLGTDMTAQCGMESRHMYRDGGWHGTGSQDEWESVRRLPLCRKCFPAGPRRPQEQP